MQKTMSTSNAIASSSTSHLFQPSQPSKGPRSRYQQNNAKYGTPLPIPLPNPHTSKSQYIPFSLIPNFLAPKIDFIACTGVYDAATRCVVVEDRGDMEVLFRKGFFGKGTLSRSEPSWRERRLDILKGGESAAAEKIREQRRIARKAFKLERAEAMLRAAKTAEAIITSTQNVTSATGEEEEEVDKEGEGEEVGDGMSTVGGDGISTVGGDVDLDTLTAQTFLVRPTRPDANRNRGKKGFKRRPAPPPGSGQQAAVQVQVQAIQEDQEEEEVEEEIPFDESVVEEMEVLQLGLEEAWFLGSALGVLKVFDPRTQTYIPPRSLLSLFLTPITPTPSYSSMRPDDPHIVSYIAYHHYRSLGWVVKPGIKFSCDWLLYRRGPVFSHAAFAIVVIPVYSDLEEKKTSPFGGEDWYEEKMSWKWINTVMRVNSLVQKTVVLAYVTIPSLKEFPQNVKQGDGTLDPEKVDMADLLKRYSVREVALTRFGIARRRD